MEFNYGLLKQKIKDVFGTYGRFANALGVPYQRLSRLLNNKAEWTNELIFAAANLLGGLEDIKDYFFTPKVHKCEQ